MGGSHKQIDVSLGSIQSANAALNAIAFNRNRSRLGVFSIDPIGFAAGDTNLYRYVGNQPMLFVDPGGLQERLPGGPFTPPSGIDTRRMPPQERQGFPLRFPPSGPRPLEERIRDNARVRVWPYKGDPGRKAEAQKEEGIPKITEIPYPGDPNKVHGVDPGQNGSFCHIPPGHYVGTTGTQPCVGLIIISPTEGDDPPEVWVFHFDAPDHPHRSIDLHDPPEGSTGVIFGGDDRMESSAGLIDAILDDLEDRGIDLLGIYNSAGMWVDSEGELHVFDTDLYTAPKDGTRPPQKPYPNE